MFIRNALRPHLLTVKLFLVSGLERKIILISEMDKDGNLQRHFVLLRIDFVFEFSDVKSKQRQLLITLVIAATDHKSQGQTLKQ